MHLTDTIGQKLLIAFDGKGDLPDALLRALETYRPAGITLFRSRNIENPAQVRRLTTDLQSAASRLGLPPLLIAVDQEGGQLMALQGATPLPGNMALGAANSEGLATRAGEVLGRELAALGINVDYAPCVDVNVNPQNPVVGVRSFGENPARAAALGAATIRGIQSQRVAATAKHFPGHGDVTGDSHYTAPHLTHTLEELRAVDLPPFRAAAEAGVKLMMTAHIALPELDGDDAPPATLSGRVLNGLLRQELGYEGVVITDAMDMLAIRQGDDLGAEALRAVNAGADLLLMTVDPADYARVQSALAAALDAGAWPELEVQRSAARVAALKDWLLDAPPAPELSVVGCAAHLGVAGEIAAASMTLVRDDARLLPLRLHPEQRAVVVMPQPRDLTPADTSSYVQPKLGDALRAYHPRVDEIIAPFDPRPEDITALLEQARGADVLIIGTLNAIHQPQQAAMVRALLGLGIPAVVAALRLPYDLAAFPEAKTYACTYSIVAPSIEALARALFTPGGFPGRLPVGIPGLYPVGHGLSG